MSTTDAIDRDLLERLELPDARACRCGDRMEIDRTEEVDGWTLIVWACRPYGCGRQFGLQVNPDTDQIVRGGWIDP